MIIDFSIKKGVRDFRAWTADMAQKARQGFATRVEEVGMFTCAWREKPAAPPLSERLAAYKRSRVNRTGD